MLQPEAEAEASRDPGRAEEGTRLGGFGGCGGSRGARQLKAPASSVVLS